MKLRARSLPSALEHRLSAYATAASAAGVGMLALAQPAQAKIVYTPTHQKLPIGPLFYLDLNHDGISDFAFHANTSDFGSHDSAFLRVYGQAAGNSVVGPFPHFCVSALRAGFRVGPWTSSSFQGHGTMGLVSVGRTVPLYYCPWAPKGKSVGHHYVGLKFVVKGKTHFGWARFNVRIYRNPESTVDAVLTGYAYETIPNKPIITGKTKGLDEAQGSLGALAAGAAGRP